ncbi:MAG: MBL fold metallo-hydrolase [Actinomycetaceae bacterium]|nr:MBL fold metallo-hydrolase [Actinomycetaceae bacterium]
MRIQRITSPFLDENAYVVSAADADEAIIIDPGVKTHQRIESYLQETGLTATAVLLTHGHADHVWDAASFGVPVHVAKPDIYRLDDPMQYLPPTFARVAHWEKPQVVQELLSSTRTYADGLPILMVPAPGHTEGSVIFLTEVPAGEAVETNCDIGGYSGQPFISAQPVAFTGDVVFAGSVGRTDLAGGDETQMRHTLRTLTNAINPQTWMFPGHGPTTVWEQEIETNPYVIRAKRIG